jgi:hypothetical protein
MPSRWIEAPDLVGEVEQPTGQAPSDAAVGWHAGHEAVGHVETVTAGGGACTRNGVI